LNIVFFQFAHFIDAMGLCMQLLCVVANAFIKRQKLQIQGNTVTVSWAPAAANASADDDDAVHDDMLRRTVTVQDVSDDMADIASVYLENPRKNGGMLESSSYNEASKQLTLCFVSQQGMHGRLLVPVCEMIYCWLGGRKGIRPVKNRVVGYWRGYLSGATCRLACGPADATATHCLLLQ